LRVLLVAGEASGDAHAARVVRLLVERGATVTAVGGEAVRAAGAHLLAHIDALAVLGIVEVVQRLPRLLAVKRRLEHAIQHDGYDLFLGVDYPGLNLRLARSAHGAGIPALHYIGPQVWAWRAHRLRHMRRYVDHVALVLPFEKPLYDAAGIPATFVGHPLLDDAGVATDALPSCDLALFPGSRVQEVRRHLPVLLRAAALVRAQRPDLSVCVSCAPTAPADWMRAQIVASGFAASVLRTAPARALMASARAMLVASGTATLEAALAARPFAVLYRTHRINFEVARRLVRLPYVGLANLVAGEAVVREYLQDDAAAPALAREAERLLTDEAERARIVRGLDRVRARLGTPGAAGRVAALATALAERVRTEPA
jgi:lipid-A-disaccharide synthase